MVQLTFYGGVGEIGGSKILVTTGDTSIFLDFGFSFGQRGRFYQEFLSPRSVNCVGDLLCMGLLPDIDGLYRDDPVGGQRFEEKHPARAVLLSHAHIDHSGHISMLRPDIELYTSPASHRILQAIETTGIGGMESEVLTQSIRRSGQHRYDKVSRPVIECLPYESVSIGSLNVTMCPVDHSIPGSCAIIVESDGKCIVYSGDFRFHGRRSSDTIKFVDYITGLNIDAILIEGTNAGEQHGPTEDDVKYKAHQYLQQAQGRPALCMFAARDLDRLKTFYDIAVSCGRKFCVSHKTAYLLDALADCNLGLPLSDDVFIYAPRKKWGTYDEREYGKWEREYLNRPNSVTAIDVKSDLLSYLICLDFFSLNELIDIKPRGGVLIHSLSEPFTEEMEFDFDRLQNWLSHFDIEYRHAHASGHLYQHQLVETLSEVTADTIIPIHTENSEIFYQFAHQVRLVTTGQTVTV